MRFCAVDGEGVTGEDGTHRYVLLGVGTEQIENPDGLDWKTCFEFLYKQYRPGTAYVGFFLLYDFTQILKTLPENRARMLWTSEGRAVRRHRTPHRMPHPVEYDGWQFDLLGTKRLRIRPKTCACRVASCKCKHAPWMYVCDVGGFFQTSFVNVIDPSKWRMPIVSEDEFVTILEGKKRRKTALLDSDMRKYNVLENEILERVMSTLDTGFLEMQVHLPASKWFGPGQAAQTWMKHKAPTREDVIRDVPHWFLDSARASYFGGWFETFVHGYVPGITHEYDINSAYPDIIANLPCLSHGKYDRGNSADPIPRGNGITLVHATIQGKNPHVGAMLHRDTHGRITRPHNTAGWYWKDELDAAEQAGLVHEIQVHEWMHYQPCGCPPPLRDIRDLYQLRLDKGKDTPLGKAAKTTYNSGYGKFAQSIGEPVYGNAVYASRIPSGCRKKIYQAIASHPRRTDALVMVATDAVYFLDEHPQLPVTEQLGEWDHKEKANLTVFKPGVYWDDKAREAVKQGKNAIFKARGISGREFSRHLDTIDHEFQSWKRQPPAIRDIYGIPGLWPMVEYTPEFAMTTCLQALRRGKWQSAGTVQTAKPLKQSSNPADKRTGIHVDTWGPHTIYRSRPHPYGANARSDEGYIQSEPYTKRFGMDDPWSDENREEYGITEDGYAADEIKDILTDTEGIDYDGDFTW